MKRSFFALTCFLLIASAADAQGISTNIPIQKQSSKTKSPAPKPGVRLIDLPPQQSDATYEEPLQPNPLEINTTPPDSKNDEGRNTLHISTVSPGTNGGTSPLPPGKGTSTSNPPPVLEKK